MTQFLSDEWFAMVTAESAKLPEVSGLDARLAYTVSATPSGKLQFVVDIAGGRIASIEKAKNPQAGCSVQLTYAQARELLEGTLDREVAYMRGDLKLDGDYASYVLRLMPWFASDATDRLRRAVAAATEF